MPSVIAAAMNNADASNSFAPCVLLKCEPERIQTSRGILQMRLNVMEFGRFTLQEGSGGRPATRFDYAPPKRGTQWKEKMEGHRRDGARYVSTRGDIGGNVSVRNYF